VPAAAARQGVQALFVLTGCKGYVGGCVLCLAKYIGYSSEVKHLRPTCVECRFDQGFV